MKTNLIVVDDFYENPDEVRKFALSQEFSVTGNYPGKRTKSFLSDGIKEGISSIMYNIGGEVTNWFEGENGSGYTGAFQLCTSQDRTWIHGDYYNMWAGVCYLTPDAPVSGGTALYRYKENGDRISERGKNTGYDSYDYTKWEVVDRVGNIYNRLILYPGHLYHASVDYFGNDIHSGRLFQTFFFDTEY